MKTQQPMRSSVNAVVLSTEQGLGYLARDFYRAGILDKVLIKKHSSRPPHPEWFGEWKHLFPSNYDWLLDGCKTLLLFETAFDWDIVKLARKRGIKTVLMPMYECTPNPLPAEVDTIICPSDLDQKTYPTGIRLNVPVPKHIKWTQRTTARRFVHNSGNGGLGGRNGTAELIEALRFIKNPIDMTIRFQSNPIRVNDSRVRVEVGSVPDEQLWDGDVFVFPEKFNGLSMPMQEAFASGMAVMGGNRFPMNRWLPNEILIKPSGYFTDQIAIPLQVAMYEPKEIARTIDQWYGKDISHLSLAGKKFGEENSWSALKDKYLSIL